jgi:hypothetical protein
MRTHEVQIKATSVLKVPVEIWAEASRKHIIPLGR